MTRRRLAQVVSYRMGPFLSPLPARKPVDLLNAGGCDRSAVIAVGFPPPLALSSVAVPSRSEGHVAH